MREIPYDDFLAEVRAGNIRCDNRVIYLHEDNLYYKVRNEDVFIMSLNWFRHYKSYWTFDIVNVSQSHRY